MNKIIISLISSFMFLFVIWCIVLFAKYGNDWTHYRIDFRTAFDNLNLNIEYATLYTRFNNTFEEFEQNILDYEIWLTDYFSEIFDSGNIVLKVLVQLFANVSNAVNYIRSFLLFIGSFLKNSLIWVGYSLKCIMQIFKVVFDPVVYRV